MNVNLHPKPVLSIMILQRNKMKKITIVHLMKAKHLANSLITNHK